jgi:hypothetical protein
MDRDIYYFLLLPAKKINASPNHCILSVLDNPCPRSVLVSGDDDPLDKEALGQDKDNQWHDQRYESVQKNKKCNEAFRVSLHFFTLDLITLVIGLFTSPHR